VGTRKKPRKLGTTPPIGLIIQCRIRHAKRLSYRVRIRQRASCRLYLSCIEACYVQSNASHQRPARTTTVESIRYLYARKLSKSQYRKNSFLMQACVCRNIFVANFQCRCMLEIELHAFLSCTCSAHYCDPICSGSNASYVQHCPFK
jgi:hypothetical protein